MKQLPERKLIGRLYWEGAVRLSGRRPVEFAASENRFLDKRVALGDLRLLWCNSRVFC